MITALTRVARLREVLRRYASQPFVQGRAAQIAGTALVADGLIGIDNPLDGNGRRRPGILGALLIIAVGSLFVGIAPGLTAQVEAYPQGRTTQGTVVEVARESTDADRCSASARYEVRGSTYVVEVPGTSAALCRMEGQELQVSYRPRDPAAGRALLTQSSFTARALPWLGWLLVVVGSVTALLRLAAITFGLVLLVRGRALTRGHPEVPIEAVLADLHEAWSSRTTARTGATSS